MAFSVLLNKVREAFMFKSIENIIGKYKIEFLDLICLYV